MNEVLVIVWTLVALGPDATVGTIPNIVSQKDCMTLRAELDTRSGLYTCVRTYLVRDDIVKMKLKVEHERQ